MDETRERFLTAIVARLGAERIVELHMFSPLRSGVIETGVAVVAVLPDLQGAEAEAGRSAEAGAIEHVPEATDIVAEHGAHDAPEASPYLDIDAVPAEEVVVGVKTPAESRHVVFTALYRLTRKGPDRGKWFFKVIAQADAPLATVDAVARGVTQRSKDLTETERLSGDQLRTVLQDLAWRTPA